MTTDEDLARQAADILGPSSGAAQALQELDRRRASGEQVDIAIDGQRWIVYGIPPEEMGT